MHSRTALTLAVALVLVTSAAGRAAAQNTAVITGTIRNAVTRDAVVNATVRVVGSQRSYVTRGDGAYRLVLDARESELRVTALGFSPVTQTVSSTPGVPVIVDFLLQPSAVALDEVVAVGTRGLERTVARSPVPVDVIPRQMLDNTGAVETWQQLQRLVPSVNVPHISLGDNHIRPVTLRGLAPHHVLVLVNGKRRHPASVLLAGPSVPATSFTDLNAIPAGVIERIEILRDGAAAQYGSDAIAGVVNVVLKTGARRDLSTTVGEVLSSDGGRDFRDGRMFDVNTTAGLMTSSGGYLTVSGELRDRGGTNRAYPDARQQYFTGDPRNDEAPRISSYLGNGSVHDLALFLAAAVPLGANLELYAFGGAADRNDVRTDAFFRRPLDPRTVRAIHPDGFLPRVRSRTDDLSALGGVRGTLRGWRWDLSSVWGGNSVEYNVDNSNNASLGAESPTAFYAGRVAAQQWTSNLDTSRELHLGSMPLTLAAGAEFRVDRYQIRAGEPDSWRDGGVPILDGPLAGQPAAAGAQGLVGLRPADEVSADRSNSAIYLEADARPAGRLQLQAAARAERYSDFGSTSDGKLAARADIVRGIALRGSVSTGFRAPALTQEYRSSNAQFLQVINGVNTVLLIRTFPVNTAEARLLGARPLRPEMSVNQSAGIVADLPRLPLITADYYQITINDRIELGDQVTDTSIIRLFEENGMAGIGGGSYFTNGLDTRTRGLDLVVSHTFLIRPTGVLRILGGYNHSKTSVIRLADPPPELDRFGPVRFNRATRGFFERSQPRETITVTTSYSAGPVGLNLHNQRSGPTAALDQATPEADRILAAKWITDVRLTYRLGQRVQVAASVLNLFDVYPTELPDFKEGLSAQGPSIQGIFRYPGALSPFGMNGRTGYLQLTYR